MPDEPPPSGPVSSTPLEHVLLRALLEHLPDSIYFKDRQSRFIRVNAAMARWAGGGRAQDLVGRSDFDLFTAEHAQPAFDAEQRIIATGEPLLGCEEKETWPDGRTTWVSTTKLPLRDLAGTIIGTFGISHDITERKEAEEALRESEILFRSIFEASNDAILLLNEHRCLDCNPRALEMFGFADKTALGRLDLASRSPPRQPDGRESAALIRAHIATAFARAYSRFDWTFRRQDETGFPAEVVLSAFDFGGRRILQATIRDITERVRAEEALRRSEATFRGLLTAAPIGISVVRNRTILTFNAAMEQITGYNAEEMIGRGSRIFYLDDAEYLRVGTVLYGTAPGHARHAVESTWRRKDGTVIQVEMGSAPLDPADPSVGTAVTAVDISERKRAEAEHAALETQLHLAQKLESVGLLSAGIAHEINTPSQFVADNLHFLSLSFQQLARYFAAVRDLQQHAATLPTLQPHLAAVTEIEKEIELGFLQQEIPNCLGQSLDGMSRVARIVGALKDFAHPHTTDRAPADLAKLIETAAAVTRHEWKYVAEFATEFDPQLPEVPVLVDEFNQVLLNLIINAAQAIAEALKQRGEAKGRITARTRAIPEYAVVEIEDTGTGIPETARPHLFEPFFSTKGPGGGTGQGLHVVHTIMRRHGGRIEYATEVGRGTTFRLLLPLRPPAVAAAPSP